MIEKLGDCFQKPKNRAVLRRESDAWRPAPSSEGRAGGRPATEVESRIGRRGPTEKNKNEPNSSCSPKKRSRPQK